MYYTIEVINDLNISFIFIIVDITQYPTQNDAGILVLNSYPDSHFCPGCAEQSQNWFCNSLKVESPQQANPVKLSYKTVVYHV